MPNTDKILDQIDMQRSDIRNALEINRRCELLLDCEGNVVVLGSYCKTNGAEDVVDRVSRCETALESLGVSL